jgi:hypothetical protein
MNHAFSKIAFFLFILVLSCVVMWISSGRSDYAELLTAPPEIHQTVLAHVGQPASPCTVEVSDDIAPELNKMGFKDWVVACKAQLSK